MVGKMEEKGERKGWCEKKARPRRGCSQIWKDP